MKILLPTGMMEFPVPWMEDDVIAPFALSLFMMTLFSYPKPIIQFVLHALAFWGIFSNFELVYDFIGKSSQAAVVGIVSLEILIQCLVKLLASGFEIIVEKGYEISMLGFRTVFKSGGNTILCVWQLSIGFLKLILTGLQLVIRLAFVVITSSWDILVLFVWITLNAWIKGTMRWWKGEVGIFDWTHLTGGKSASTDSSTDYGA